MKVWAVYSWVHSMGGSEPHGIFSTKEAAEKFAAVRRLENTRNETTDVIEYDVDQLAN